MRSGAWARRLAGALSVVLVAPPARAQRNPLPDSYLLSLREAPPPGAPGDPRAGPVPWIFVETVASYPCLVRIPVRSRIEGRRVRIDIGDVGPGPYVCIAESGPARGRVALSLPDGLYELDVANRSRVDSYNLKVSQWEVRVGPDHGVFTRFTNTSVPRPDLTKR